MRPSSSSWLTRASMREPTSTASCARRRWRRTSMIDRHPRESGDPAIQETLGSRFRGNDELARPMAGDGCRAEPFSEAFREPLKAACAEDGEIWQIYANNFGPDGFDDSINRYTSNPNN